MFWENKILLPIGQATFGREIMRNCMWMSKIPECLGPLLSSDMLESYVLAVIH